MDFRRRLTASPSFSVSDSFTRNAWEVKHMSLKSVHSFPKAADNVMNYTVISPKVGSDCKTSLSMLFQVLLYSQTTVREDWIGDGGCAEEAIFTFSYTKRKYCNRQKIRTRDFDESPRFRPPRVRKTQFWNYVCL
ncbi:hypothetical protein AVEN_120242-1 [Araneus ventricosus]|uniref:Uncharacterized protein n=1 Tax=Araneus ventricosus TaxID=182803 RepID=A0A4Y2GZF4_ARAVE|nr:hypothetical protein AVEN_120242-1 [Araneus ventricosus]